MVRATTWNHDITLVDSETGDPVDLSGIVGVLMRVREEYASPVLLELATPTTLVIVDAINGVLGIRAGSALTNTLPENSFEPGVYLYDALIERTPDEYEPAVGGVLVVLPQVTRPLDD